MFPNSPGYYSRPKRNRNRWRDQGLANLATDLPTALAEKTTVKRPPRFIKSVSLKGVLIVFL